MEALQASMQGQMADVAGRSAARNTLIVGGLRIANLYASAGVRGWRPSANGAKTA